MSEEKTTDNRPASPAGRQPTTDNSENEIKEEDSKRDLDNKLKVMKDKYLRALADYQNLLKQTAREKEEFAKYANERLVLEILPVFDNLKLALASSSTSRSGRKHTEETPSNGESLLEGVSHIINQFTKTLRGAGVEEIETIGEKFDHNTMEAVESEIIEDPSASSGQGKRDGLVAREIAAGYKLNGKVIKAARVAVYQFSINDQ